MGKIECNAIFIDKHISCGEIDLLIGMQEMEGKIFQYNFIDTTLILLDQLQNNLTEYNKIPLRKKWDKYYIDNIYIRNKKMSFMLDLGFNSELITNTDKIIKNPIAIEAKINLYDNDYTQDILLDTNVQISMKGCSTNSNIIYNKRFNDNLLGFQFLTKFKSVIIDLREDVLYLSKDILFQNISVSNLPKFIYNADTLTLISIKKDTDYFSKDLFRVGDHFLVIDKDLERDINSIDSCKINEIIAEHTKSKPLTQLINKIE